MKRILTVLVVFFSVTSLFAQTGDKETSSLIISVDSRSRIVRYFRQYDFDSSYYSSQIEKILQDNKIVPDVVSGVIYGKMDYAQTPDSFAQLIISPTDASGGYNQFLTRLFKNIPHGNYYSITSFAKPYSLMALKNQHATNRTFLILMTDNRYNGNDDYYGEAGYMKKDFSTEGKKQFTREIKDVQTNYFCEWKDQVRISGGYIQLYEFIPLQQYFSLESVLDFPHKIVAKRGKHNYEIDFSIDSLPTPNYDVQKLMIRLAGSDEDAWTVAQIGDRIHYKVPKNKMKECRVELKSWVKLQDGFYNNTILHPHGNDLQGAAGLNRHILIEPEPNSRILGIIDLPDFLFSISFWTASQSVAAASWGGIFILLVIAIIVVIIYRSNIYKVKEGTIKF